MDRQVLRPAPPSHGFHSACRYWAASTWGGCRPRPPLQYFTVTELPSTSPALPALSSLKGCPGLCPSPLHAEHCVLGAGPTLRVRSALSHPPTPSSTQRLLSPSSRAARAALHCTSVGLCAAELRDGEGPGRGGRRQAGGSPLCRSATTADLLVCPSLVVRRRWPTV